MLSKCILPSHAKQPVVRNSWKIWAKWRVRGKPGPVKPAGKEQSVVSKNSKVYSLKTPINGHEVKIIQLIPQPLSGRRGPGCEIMDLDESEILKQRWLYAQSVKWLRNFVTLQKFRKLKKNFIFLKRPSVVQILWTEEREKGRKTW